MLLKQGMHKRVLALFLMVMIFVTAFPAGVLAAWYDSAYDYCRELTMTAGGNTNGVATTTTAGFALVATSTITTLRTTGNGGNITQTSTASGTTTPVDVIITNGTDCNSDGGSTILDFYFEKYVEATGEFVLWVEPTDISSTSQKSILLYYGNGAASDQSDESGVFGSLNEEGVYNLHEDPGPGGAGEILDSTSNNNDATASADMTAADLIKGQVDGAYDLDGTTDYVTTTADMNDTDGIARMTLMLWLDLRTAEDWAGLISKCDCGGSPTGWEFAVGATSFGGNNDIVFTPDASTGILEFSTTNFLSESAGWQHVAVTYNGGATEAAKVTFFANGAAQADDASDSPIAILTDDNAQSVRIGQHPANSGDPDLDGQIDDIRIFTRTLHAMDVLTIYNNTVSSGKFWTFGNEETETVSATRKMRLLGNVRLGGVRLLGL